MLERRHVHRARCAIHARDGEPGLYCASADRTLSNFFRRVEVAFPITEPDLRQRIINELELYLEDNTQAWALDAEGNYALAAPDGQRPVSVQKTLMEQASGDDGLPGA